MSRTISLLAIVAFGLGGLTVSGLARAGALYRCERPDRTVVYTNRPDKTAGCKVISRYSDAGAKKKPAAGSLAASRSWDYRERPDVTAGSAGVTTTAAHSDAAPPMVATAARPLPAKAPGPRILRGSVYRVERGSGITEYTNVKPRDGRFAVLFTYIATCIACDVHSNIDWTRIPLHLDDYRSEIARAAADFGVSAALLRAVIHAESAFNPLAISAKGAQGLMQLMPGTAGDLGVADAFDVAENIEGGARYLAQLLKDFNGDEKLATAAYNAGEAAVQKYGGVPPYDETRLYVKRVATLRDRYAKAL
ncbi:MAG TPA: lytic transglycosylase domain-containing protein [Rhodanobacteraceae bacterium]|nr:lytic transglycosylase domain-containing protein [Rhodanobacteraceae bacterium]